MATDYIIIVTENRYVCADFEDIRSKIVTPRAYISSLFSGDQNRYEKKISWSQLDLNVVAF